MAHFLNQYEGDCRNIHGHSYVLHVTVGGTALRSEGNSSDGMVIDFRFLKKIVQDTILNDFDHALAVNQAASGSVLNQLSEITERLIILPFQPTCENLVRLFAENLNQALPSGITLMSVRLFETASSYAEWHYVDNMEE